MRVANAGTHVFLALSAILHNDVHTSVASASSSASSGIEVTDGALLLAEFNTLVGNESDGLLVRNGASAHFRYGRIEATASITDVAGDEVGGINAQALDGGTVHLSNFRSNHGDFVGLYALRGYARANRGLVAHNPIGVAARQLPPDFPVETLLTCVAEDTLYWRNAVQLDADFLPVPCPGGPCAVCPVSVPFVCTWCG